MTEHAELIISKQFDGLMINSGAQARFEQNACKGWIYHVDILLQPILPFSLPGHVFLTHITRLFKALPYSFFGEA